MRQIARELWVSQKDQFLFRMRMNDALWTFRISRHTLEVLDTTGGQDPQALFDVHRAHIYAAAARLAATGNPTRQQTITERELKQASAA